MFQLEMLLSFRWHKKESDLANALVQWRSIESALISKEAEYSKLLSEKRNLGDAFSDLQNQLDNVSANTRHSCRAWWSLWWFSHHFSHKDVCVCLLRWRVFWQVQRTS